MQATRDERERKLKEELLELFNDAVRSRRRKTDFEAVSETKLTISNPDNLDVKSCILLLIQCTHLATTSHLILISRFRISNSASSTADENCHSNPRPQWQPQPLTHSSGDRKSVV